MSEQMESDLSVLAGFSAYYAGDFTRLTRFVIKLGATLEEAQDAAQEAMNAALLSWPTIDHPHAFTRMAARRIFLRERMKTARVREAVLNDGHGGPHAPAAFDASVHYVLQLLGKLPAEQREVMAWTLDGYGPTEIAEATGRKPATVRSHLRHARQRLQKLHQQHTDTAGKEESDGAP